MHARRLICFILGFWFAGGIVTTAIALLNASGADHALEQPSAVMEKALKGLPPAAVHTIVHQQVDQEILTDLRLWESIQFGIGLAFLLFVVLGTTEGRMPIMIAAALLILVLLERFTLNPEFRSGPALPRDRLLLQGQFYFAVEAAKAVAQLFLVGRMVAAGRGGAPSGNARQKIDPIYEANYRHVNG